MIIFSFGWGDTEGEMCCNFWESKDAYNPVASVFCCCCEGTAPEMVVFVVVEEEG